MYASWIVLRKWESFFIKCMRTSCNCALLYTVAGSSPAPREAGGEDGGAGFLGSSGAFVVDCWNTLGESSSDGAAPGTTSPALVGMGLMRFGACGCANVAASLGCADAAGMLVKTAGAFGVGSRKLCGVTSVLGMKPGTAVGLGTLWPSFLSGLIY